uniref:Type III potassium channel toxin protein n=1 Tax=Anemonia sulcata TaxID=6108 RepID=A0A0S1M198_ANESU|nr:type III potassium channel toxin protein [Anemonia sulcata]
MKSVVLIIAIVCLFVLAQGNDEKVYKRLGCACTYNSKKVSGVYYFAHGGCPNGHGYNAVCGAFLGICCYRKPAPPTQPPIKTAPAPPSCEYLIPQL